MTRMTPRETRLLLLAAILYGAVAIYTGIRRGGEGRLGSRQPGMPRLEHRPTAARSLEARGPRPGCRGRPASSELRRPEPERRVARAARRRRVRPGART